MKDKKKKPKSVSKLKKDADKLWSLNVRKNCICGLCGKHGEMKDFDAHHIRARGNISTRWDLDNGVCLCKGCHRFKVHIDTLTVGILIEKLKIERGQKWYDNLVRKSNQAVRCSRREINEIIEALCIDK